jgi:hypothetical protein
LLDRLLCIIEYSIVNISKEEAEQALRDIEASRLAMRDVIRSHRGHLFLWLWGAIWIAIPVLFILNPERYLAAANWLTVLGAVGSFAIGWGQGRQIRAKVDKRFVATCITLLVFGYGVWPIFLGSPHSYKAAYGYGLLLWMQIYMVAGIWFRNYWLWIGAGVTALLLVGFLFFPAQFWWFSLAGGATLVATGFYVRFVWR